MNEENHGVWTILRIAGPIVMFFVILFLCTYVLSIPLVLSVVLALLFAIIEWGTLTWLQKRMNPS